VDKGEIPRPSRKLIGVLRQRAGRVGGRCPQQPLTPCQDLHELFVVLRKPTHDFDG
jgi:hypothetical protein